MTGLSRRTLLAAAGSLTASRVGAQGTRARTLQIGYMLPEHSHQGRAVAAFARDVERLSAGRLKVRSHAAGALGHEVQMQQALIAGTQDMMVGATATLVALARQMALWDTPFLFRSTEEADALLDGPVGDKVLHGVAETGIVGLVYWENGFRHVTNNVRPVQRHEDLARLRLRVMQNAVYLDSFKALGADAVPLPFSDVVPGLEGQTLDGQENPLNTVVSTRLFLMQKYLSLTHHAYSPWLLTVSRKVWDTLTPADREVLRTAARQGRTAQRADARRETAGALAELKSSGMSINMVSPYETGRMRDKLARINASVAGSIGMDLWREAQAQLAALRPAAGRPGVAPPL